MTSAQLKSRFIYYVVAGLIAAAIIGYKLNSVISSTQVVFLTVASLLSAILLYRLIAGDQRPIPGNQSRKDLDQKNIRLALNFQGQGKLDAAYALYRQCSPSDRIVSLLINLAKDYEIINQQNLAEKVYSHILILQPDNPLAQSKIPHKSRRLKASPEKSDKSDKDRSLFNDRYEIRKNIGKGTGSNIFLARDHHNHQQHVALKILEINYDQKNALEAELLARFMREAETAASLKHQNIIKIIDSGHANNVAFIVMEYIRGKSLKEYSQPETLLPQNLIIELIAQCADGLQYAHDRGIIHRDVKPANIVYDHANSCAKLGDFGIAHIANSTQTLAGSLLGTPFYMSPEQLNSQEVDARSDIFSLGATLYRLLTGEPPFSGNSMAGLMYTIVNEPHRKITEIKPNLPKNLVDVVEIALAKDPAQRFASAAEFSQQLRRCGKSQ